MPAPLPTVRLMSPNGHEGGEPGTTLLLTWSATARMMGAGLSPTEVAQRATADFFLMGGHRESDHATFIELWPASGDESLLRRDFELDESRPAHAPPELIETIRMAITEAANR